MSHKECHDITKWKDPIMGWAEQCLEQPCNWWCLCCNKWLCGLVWVVVIAGAWVVEQVCELVADVIDLVVTVVVGLIDIVVGIFTGDWTRVVAGFGEIVGAFIVFAAEIIPVVTGGTLVGAFADAINAWQLRDFARGLIDQRFRDNPEVHDSIVEGLGISSGTFGLRLKATAIRSFIRSDFSSPQNNGTPDLIVWLTDKSLNLDLKTLAGLNPSAWWNRDWPQLVGDNGNISAADLDNYIAKGGVGGDVKHFTIFSMSQSDLQTRTDTATLHAKEIGLILQWDFADTQILAGNEVVIDVDNFVSILQQPPFMRNANNAAAITELCAPLAIAAFGFLAGFNGISAHLASSTCLEPDETGSLEFPGEGITGTAFRYRKPDIAFKYVAIHEIGHTFGLCHVDGLLRIMFTARGKNYSSTSSWWQYWTHGVEAGFTLDEGKKVWEYIVTNFGADCLRKR